MRRSLLLLPAAALIAALPHLAGAQGTKPALYTADQATAGAAVYGQACAACHGAQLEGVAAPALKGSAFGEMANAQSLTAGRVAGCDRQHHAAIRSRLAEAGGICRGDRLYPAAERLSRRLHGTGQGCGRAERRQGHALNRTENRDEEFRDRAAGGGVPWACAAAPWDKRKRRRRSAVPVRLRRRSAAGRPKGSIPSLLGSQPGQSRLVPDAAGHAEGRCQRCDDAGLRSFRRLDRAWPHLRQSALLAFHRHQQIQCPAACGPPPSSRPASPRPAR